MGPKGQFRWTGAREEYYLRRYEGEPERGKVQGLSP
jgi:hypothetical protein